MIYVTGDTHGSYKRLRTFFRGRPASRADVLIVLGDTGLNYHGDERDQRHKDSAARLPLTLLCLRGNHDRRPETLPGSKRLTRFGGTVYAEDAYPNILYAAEGELYTLEGKSALAVGGAYSVDKAWRLEHGYHWFADEQLAQDEMGRIEARVDAVRWRVDTVLTHTCPLRYEPTEALFSGIDQRTVDKTMERWLDSLEQRLTYRQWMCGHFHIDKREGPIRFLYTDVVTL